jgi:hypothetical protein
MKSQKELREVAATVEQYGDMKINGRDVVGTVLDPPGYVHI